MKFMKLGTKPDTLYIEENTRSISSDLPSDLTIQILNTTYLLHKFPLLPKCGFLQRIRADSGNSIEVPIELNDIPGGQEGFEFCVKFCYGIIISISAQNFVPAICAATFLWMTEFVQKGNFILKLEAFFSSCILEGWKDSIITLQSTKKLSEWSENLRITRRCMDSVVEKILTHPSKVPWPYTYTRPGYSEKRHSSVPKDWWTEDISDLDIDLFRCIITAVRSSNVHPPQLIGEALHVYACRWLPDTTKTIPIKSSRSHTNEVVETHLRVLETIISMIPTDQGSVSVGFLLRLLNQANFLGASSPTMAELTRRSGRQLEEARVSDLLSLSHSPSGQRSYIELVERVLESFVVQWRREGNLEDDKSLRSLRKVAKLIDSYLQVVSRDINLPAMKVTSLVESFPDVARPEHDNLYKAINIYLKEHPDLSKAEKKRLCRILDCQRLSPEVCAHAVKNERLPLRTVVQVLFFEQERGARMTTPRPPPPSPTEMISLRSDNGGKDLSNGPTVSIGEKDPHKIMKSDIRRPQMVDNKVPRRKVRDMGIQIEKEIREGVSGINLNS